MAWELQQCKLPSRAPGHPGGITCPMLGWQTKGPFLVLFPWKKLHVALSLSSPAMVIAGLRWMAQETGTGLHRTGGDLRDIHKLP